MKIIFLLLFVGVTAQAEIDFKSEFGDRNGCFLIKDLKTGAVIADYNAKRCEERFSPCSSFKIAAAVMAFDKGVLKDENQIVKWDGIKRDRPEINKDQTPFTWMSDSVKWVTEWIMPQLGQKTVQSFLSMFSYGNQDFSGGMKDSWVSSSLKISAQEQVAFLQKLWLGKLPVSKRAVDLTKKISFIKKLGKDSELYGKTGTGCLVGHDCMEYPGKMLGWFVGVLKTPKKEYVFAANGSDLKNQKDPGGPRMRKTVISILDKMNLESDSPPNNADHEPNKEIVGLSKKRCFTVQLF
jgi:beta-lactamase class D